MLQNFTDSYLVCTCLSKLCYCPSIYIPMFCKISLGGKLQNNICCELSNRSFCTFLPWSPATKLCSLFDLLTSSLTLTSLSLPINRCNFCRFTVQSLFLNHTNDNAVVHGKIDQLAESEMLMFFCQHACFTDTCTVVLAPSRAATGARWSKCWLILFF